MSDQNTPGIYHCLIHGISTTSRSEMKDHIRERHPGRTTSNDPDDFFYKKGETYRVFCVRDERGRRPGCGFERYMDGEDEAQRLAKRHSNSHQATYEWYGDVGADDE